MGLQVHSLETLDGAKNNKRGWVGAGKIYEIRQEDAIGGMGIVCAFNSMGE